MPSCCKISVQGEVIAASRYPLPDGARIQDYLITNVQDTIRILMPIHLQNTYPLDDVLMHGI